MSPGLFIPPGKFDGDSAIFRRDGIKVCNDLKARKKQLPYFRDPGLQLAQRLRRNPLWRDFL